MPCAVASQLCAVASCVQPWLLEGDALGNSIWCPCSVASPTNHDRRSLFCRFCQAIVFALTNSSSRNSASDAERVPNRLSLSVAFAKRLE